MKLYFLIYLALCGLNAHPSESLHDDGIRFYFGDPPFGTMLSDIPLVSRDGFQFFLTTNVSVSVLTCLKDYSHVKGQMHWKLVIKHSRSPLEQPTLRQDKIKGVHGAVFSAYLNPNSTIIAEKSAIEIVKNLDLFNKSLSNNFEVNALGRGDPDALLTSMQIMVSKVSDEKQTFVKGLYTGKPDTKRTAAFELYEQALIKLLVLSGL